MSKKHTTEDILQLLDSKNLVWVDKAWGGKRNFKNIKYRDNIKNEYFKNHPEIIFVRISYTEKNPLEYIKKILYDKDLIQVR